MTATPPETAAFEITIPAGPLVCGYCGETELFDHVPPAPQWLMLGYIQLTGFHSLGVGPAGELVVLAEITHLNGRRDCLPHLCQQIPAGVLEEYAADIAAILAGR
jgi:hypothetical protein